MLTAGKIARSAEQARAQFEAEEGISAAVTVYRATMVFDHEQLYEVSAYSKDYTSVEGQEAFASEVLVRLPYVSAKASENIKNSGNRHHALYADALEALDRILAQVRGKRGHK